MSFAALLRSIGKLDNKEKRSEKITKRLKRDEFRMKKTIQKMKKSLKKNRDILREHNEKSDAEFIRYMKLSDADVIAYSQSQMDIAKRKR